MEKADAEKPGAGTVSADGLVDKTSRHKFLISFNYETEMAT